MFGSFSANSASGNTGGGGFGTAGFGTSGFGSTGTNNQLQTVGASTTAAGSAGTTNKFGSSFNSTGTSSFGTPSVGFGMASSTPGFGMPPSTSSGFGAFQQPNNSNNTTSAFGVTNSQQKPSMFGSFGSFGAAPSTQQSTANIGAIPQPQLQMNTWGQQPSSNIQQVVLGNNGQPITEDTKFVDLPETYQNAIESTNKLYKIRMREGLDEISRFNPKVLEELRDELNRTNLAALKLKFHQEKLLSETEIFHNEAKHNLRDVRKYGVSGITQLQNKGRINYGIVSDDLPTDFYIEVANKIELRLRSCINDIEQISKQLTTTIDAVDNNMLNTNNIGGLYGQQIKIGPQHLVRLIQQQNEAFVRIASQVAQVHEHSEELRQLYMKHVTKHSKVGGGVLTMGNIGGEDNQKESFHRNIHNSTHPHPRSHHVVNPFVAADKIEEAKERILRRRLRDEEIRYCTTTTTTNNQLTSTNNPSTASMSSGLGLSNTGGFGGFGTNTGGALGGGFGTSTPSTLGGFGTTMGGGFGTSTPGTLGSFGSFGTTNSTAPSTTNAFSSIANNGFSLPSSTIPASNTGFNSLGSGTNIGGGFGSTLTSSGSVVKGLDLATPNTGFGGFGSGGFNTIGQTSSTGFSTASNKKPNNKNKK